MQLQRTESALLDLRPFSHQPFVIAIILSALLFMTLLGAGAILLPIYLQNVLGVERGRHRASPSCPVVWCSASWAARSAGCSTASAPGRS